MDDDERVPTIPRIVAHSESDAAAVAEEVAAAAVPYIWRIQAAAADAPMLIGIRGMLVRSI